MGRIFENTKFIFNFIYILQIIFNDRKIRNNIKKVKILSNNIENNKIK